MSSERDDVEVLEQRGALGPLLQLPRLIAGALDDLHTIARAVRYLPELAQILSSIDHKVDSLDEEVKLMRRKVDEIGEEVDGVQMAVAPIGRLADRMPRRRRAEPDSPS